MITLIPAYGRDYTNAKTVVADYKAEKDFVLADITSPYDGKLVNRQQLNGEEVKIRYSNLRKFTLVK